MVPDSSDIVWGYTTSEPPEPARKLTNAAAVNYAKPETNPTEVASIIYHLKITGRVKDEPAVPTEGIA
jgi:hypothetical protein